MKSMQRFMSGGVGLAVLLCTACVQAQTDVVLLKRQADLRDAPGPTARSVLQLPAQTALTRLPARQGPWMQVKTEAGQTGWVHLFDIGAAPANSAAAGTASGALRGLTGFLNRGSAQGGAGATGTSTIGIRGLGAQDIANAQPNPQAVAQAEALRVDAGQANRFAAEAQLSARAVDPLPEPQAPASASNANRNVGN